MPNSGLYYKHITIVNYDTSSIARVVNYYPRVMSQYGASLRHHLWS